MQPAGGSIVRVLPAWLLCTLILVELHGGLSVSWGSRWWSWGVPVHTVQPWALDRAGTGTNWDSLWMAAFRQVSPTERLPQLRLLANAAASSLQQMAMCQSYIVHMQYPKNSQLCLPEGKSMTPASCITLAVCPLHLRPLKGLVHSPGSILIHYAESLPCRCLPSFQASTTFQEWDPGLKKSKEGMGEGTNRPENSSPGVASR